jgi:spermidine synthase
VSRRPPAPPSAPAPVAAPGAPPPRWALATLFAAAGAFTLAAQTVLLREHLIVYGGNELGVGVFFGAWFLWVAVGAWLPLRSVRLRAALARRLAWLPLLYPLALLGEVLLVRALRGLIGAEAYEAPPVGPLLLGTALVGAPVCVVTGLLFPAGAARAAGEGAARPASAGATAAATATSTSTAAAAAGAAPGAAPDAAPDAAAAVRPVTGLWSLEAVGAVLGGLAVTVALDRVESATDLALAAALAMTLATAAFAAAARERAPLVAAGLLAALLLAALGTPPGARLRGLAEDARAAALLPGVPIVAAADTPYQHAAVAARDGQAVLLLNGRVAAAYPAGDRPLGVTALALGQRPRPRSVLLVGTGAPALVPPLLTLTDARLTLVWPDRRAAALLAPHLPAELGAALADPRLAVLHSDPRALLAGPEAPAGAPFDLVLLDLPDPDTAVAGRFYTAEFFAALRDRMTADGVLLTRLRAGENVLGPAQRRYGASVLVTLAAVFPQTALVPGEETWFVAGRETAALLQDPAALAARYAGEARQPERFPEAVYATLVEPARVAAARAAYEAAAADAARDGTPLVNRDARPVAAFANLVVWAAQSGPGLVAALDAVRAAGAWLLLVPLGLLLLVRGHRAAVRGGDRAARDRWNGGALMAAVGGGSIALQLALLLAFQSRFGDLYWLVGLLNAVFMAGLALGGAAGARLLPRLADPPRAALAVAAALAGGALLLPLVLDAAAAAGSAWTFGALAFALGAGAGVGFPAAGGLAAAGSGVGGRSAGALAGALDRADHAGAALGAVTAGVVLLPVLGRAATCQVVAAAVAVPLLLVAGELLAPRLPAALRARLERARAARRRPSLRADRLAHALLWAATSVVLVAAVVRADGDRPRLRFDAAELQPLVRADRFEAREVPYPHTVGFDQGRPDRPAVAVAASRAVAPDVEGWGGPLNLLVAVDDAGRIARVRLLESRETSAYVAGLDAWLERLQGRPATAPPRLGAGEGALDALTGATVTSQAAVDAVGRTATALARDVWDLPVTAPPAPPGFWARLGARGWYLLAALLLAVPVVLFVRRRWLRRAVLFTNLVLGGFLFDAVFSLEQAANLALGRLPGAGDPAGLVLVLGVVALGLLLGPAYCAAVCPLGAAQELVGDAAGARPPAAGLYDRVRSLKYVLLALALTAVALGARGALDMDPLRHAFAPWGGWSAWVAALLLLVLAASALFPRFWCRALCPVGALLNLFNGVALLRRFRPARRPAACDLGTARPVADLDCLQCNRCAAGGATRPAAEAGEGHGGGGAAAG